VRELFPVPPARAHELAQMPYLAYLDSPEWQARRKAKLIEAGHRCVVCNSPNRLEVHHRTYQRRGNEDRTDLTVLCRRCHSLFHEKPVDLDVAA
jgi:5-methylcytosine-specific restriction endonuclease McrA